MHEKTIVDTILAASVALLTTYFFFIDIHQLWSLNISYFYSIANIVDITSFMTIFAIIGNEMSEEYLDKSFISGEIKPFVVAAAVCSLWFKAFDWMRVFRQPAFFILLIRQTLYDILSFLLLVAIIIMFFANWLYIFNMSERSIYPSGGESSIYSDYTSLY